MVYLDYAAATPIEKDVIDVFYDTSIKYFANPNSIYKLGLDAKKMIEKETKNIADKLNILSDEIIYVSGATEANNLAIKGICDRYKSFGKHIIISSLEHTSVVASASILQENGFEIDTINVNSDGLIDINELKNLIREDTILVSITSIDSELGIRQPIEEIAKVLKEYPNIHFHTDASQAIGKVDIDLSDVDLITIAPHKFYGISDIALLIKKKKTELRPIINGGRSTTVYRSGTPNLPSIVALSKSIEIALSKKDERYKYIEKINKEVKDFLSSYKEVEINSTSNSIIHIINFSINGVNSNDFSKKLEEYEVYISPKTTCCPPNSPSKLVYALTHDKKRSTTSLRLSLSHLTTNSEIAEFKKVFDKCYKEFINGKV